MTLETIAGHRRLGRKVTGIAAALLPYEAEGKVAVDAFQEHLVATQHSGLMNAVNMDAGYVNLLTSAERRDVLSWTRQALGNGVPFVAGAFIEHESGDVVDLYRREIDVIVAAGGIPILFQTARLHGKSAAEKARIYREICCGYPHVLAFELSPQFAPNGEVFDEETFLRLLEIPELKGMKHSSLDRLLELSRLSLRDVRRPDFTIYTGNDLGIDMIEYGSDYLLGLATFAPEKFAKRDRLWQAGDPAYCALSDALQYLGNVAFRDPVPAYKHSAALFLHAAGRIPTSLAHPKSPPRPFWEAEILGGCQRRLESASAMGANAVKPTASSLSP
jgi:4-hydroxy-tetrahydrodipicolinate synthase